MLVKYYKDKELAYSNRKRYNSFDFVPFNQEEHKSVLLGDGANTEIKTSKSNLAVYVIIDNTRWYVTSYIYMNGGQITMYLQRDVIGEFGIDNCFGKVERGYTDSLLKNRKELSLNEILKDRKKIIPNTFRYGNYSVDNHDNEMWGVIYLTKPTGIDPKTGNPYPEIVNVNIPKFAPQVLNYPLIEDKTRHFVNKIDNVTIQYCIVFINSNNHDEKIGMKRVYSLKSSVSNNGTINNWKPDIVDYSNISVDSSAIKIYVNKGLSNDMETVAYSLELEIFGKFLDKYGYSSNPQNYPKGETFSNLQYNYDNVTVREQNNFYRYTAQDKIITSSGSISTATLKNFFEQELIGFSGGGYTITNVNLSDSSFETFITNNIKYNVIEYTRHLLSSSESGNITLDSSTQLIDEPYHVIVFPLYDVKITGEKEYNVKKSEAFMIFNSVIQALSGENAYLIDAQIYPYCPLLARVLTEINDYPFFQISSNTYTHHCEIKLQPDIDIKKEYMKRVYSIISPEQSGKINFNFYDYKTKIIENGNINDEVIKIYIKTALKPFSIISCAIIEPDVDSLIGITYPSDLRGSSSTANGFQCSLSSNAFETYKRQNSNDQQIFNLQKEELSVMHETEKINEVTSAVINTISATSMGAIAGGSAGGFLGIGSTAGASIGGTLAGGAVGVANAIQISQNDKLREFERNQQQQLYDMKIGTIKNLPNSINRISSFNEILLQDFWYIVETYECSEYEKILINDFIDNYGYGIGVFGIVKNFYKNGWFLRSTLIKSSFPPNLHNIASNELNGGIYYYE